MNFSDPQKQIDSAESLGDLRKIWEANIEAWKVRDDFKSIVDAKENTKFRFTWASQLLDLMLAYNDEYDRADNSRTVAEAIEHIECADALVRQMNKIWDEVSERLMVRHTIKISADEYDILSAFVEWIDNDDQVKFNVSQQTGEKKNGE